MAGSERVAIGGSERSGIDVAPVGPADPDGRTAVTVYLRGDDPPVGARMTREEWSAAYGARPQDVATLEAFAVEHHLTVESVDRARRAVVLSGRIGDLSDAFGVSMARYRDASGTEFRGHEGSVTVPRGVAPAVQAVVGLDQRPQARIQLRPAAAGASGYSPAEVADAYAFPPGTDGTGQCVAIVELGGGYRPADIAAYFAGLGVKEPSVSAVPVDGGANAPGAASGPDGEVMLDIEVIGAAAPGAKIVVYFAPNTDRGFIDAVSTAVHDSTNKPSVVSISWGGPESTWTQQAAQQMEQVFTQAATLGVAVTVASGDNGSTDGVTDGAQHADFPASAPHALACGGTRLVIGSGAPTETVWDELAAGGGATGGGVSDLFPLPAYQVSANVPPSANPGGRVGRGVPDVSGDADPQTGYRVRVDGQDTVIGGTSAVAPLWAALVARLNQGLGHDVGDLHAALYASRGVLRDVTGGNNGAYVASAGWDACTGLGSPDGTKLLAALKAAPTPPA
jgi:kumamolisin